MSENKKQRLESVAHYLTAFVIFLKGFDKIGTPGKTGFALLFILLAALILLGTIFHHTIEKKFKHFKPVVFLFEGIVIAIVGYLYQKDGKQYLPFVCYAAALVFLIATIMHFIKRTSAARSTQ